MTATKKPGLGFSPKLKDSAQFEKWAQRVTEILQVYEGVKGDKTKLDRVVTWRDFEALGYEFDARGRLVDGGTDPGGGGGGTGTLPPYSTPPAPTGLTVMDGFGNIFLSWDVTSYAYLSHTEVWRAEVDNLGVAVKVQDAVGNLVADPVGTSSPIYYYWIRYISTYGDPGPYNATAGVSGRSSPNPDELLELLEGSLDYQGLLDRIDLIDAPGTGLVDSLAQEILDRVAAITGEAATRVSQISTVTGLANAAQTSANVAISRLNDTGEGLSIEALAAAVESLTASSGEDGTIAAAAYSKASTVETRLNNATGPTSGVTMESVATDAVALKATVEHGTTGLAATKAIVDTVKTRLDNTGGGVSLESLSSTVAAQGVTISHGTTGLAAAHTRSATVETRLSDVGGTSRTLEVLGTDFSSLRSQVLDPINGLNALATIVTSQTTTINSHGATLTSQATTINQLSASVDDNTAAISSEATVRASETGALFAKATLKLDVNGYVTGWSMNNDGQAGEMIIVADKFSIAPVPTNPTAADGSPFFHLTTSTTVNGVVLPSGTYLKTAFIGDATITNAKIGSVAVDKITGNIAQFIQGNFNILQSSNFSDTTRTGWQLNVNGNHKIYGTGSSEVVANSMQSSNYATGVSGFKLSYNGFFEAHNAFIRGNVEATSIKADAANIISTLHLQGNAVSVAGAAQMNFSGFTTSGVWVTVGTVTFDFSGASANQAVVCMLDVTKAVVNAAFGNSWSMTWWVHRAGLVFAAQDNNHLIRTETEEVGGGRTRVTTRYFVTFIDNAGPGVHTYTIQARMNSLSGSGSPPPGSSFIGSFIASGGKK
ncbi:MAG: hypothetical protein HPY82_05675 [Gammaproteobacteria bacterium]|nr:hypothetical protein [Gammaproteobacteria bacterium]